MSSAGQPGSSSSDPGREEESSTKNPACKKLRSTQSRNYSFVRFLNGTQRRVKVIWINYRGDYVSYHDVSPGGFLDVNTFESHPWVFEDADTGDRVLVMGREVFEPVAYDIKTDAWPPQRKEYKIHLPVFRLERRCLQVVRDCLSPEQLRQVDLPAPLRREVQQALAAKHAFLHPQEPPPPSS